MCVYVCALQDQGKCWLISEFMPGGTLAAWLHHDKGPLGPNKPLVHRVQRALDVSAHTSSIGQ